jgi:hypothetical protein
MNKYSMVKPTMVKLELVKLTNDFFFKGKTNHAKIIYG